MTHSYIGGIDQQPSFTLEGYPLYEVDNVSSITIENTPKYGWDVTHDPSLSGEDNTNKYIDCIVTSETGAILARKQAELQLELYIKSMS